MRNPKLSRGFFVGSRSKFGTCAGVECSIVLRLSDTVLWGAPILEICKSIGGARSDSITRNFPIGAPDVTGSRISQKMCSAIQIKGKVMRPGKPLGTHTGKGAGKAIWTGFARNEIRSWWERRGLTPVDVPAEQFAERSDKDGKLRWAAVPHGLVLRGLCEERNGIFSVRMVTRAALTAEREEFEHERMPVLEVPLFSAELIVIEEDAPQIQLLPGFDP